MTNPDIRIEGGDHIFSITHTEQINVLLEQFIAKLTEK